jgi:Flp pilus assembly protein TadD
LLFYDRKPEEAEQAWKRAVRLDPTYAYAWHCLAVFGSFVWRRLHKARAAIEEARRLEPLSAPIACDVGFTLYANGQYLEAIDACHAAMDLHPSFSRTYVCLARAHAALGRYAASVETCIQGRPLFTGRAFLGQLLATQAYSYGRLGRSDDAMNILHGLERDSAEHYVALMDLAVIQTGMGNAALAIALLERANAAGEYWSISIPTEPLLHSLHGEPRFRNLAARLFEPVTPSR